MTRAVVVRALVKRSFYRDSVALMRVAETLRARPGVSEAAALMGTPANHELLAGAGLAAGDTADATPSDLILAVAARDAATADEALMAGDAILAERARTRESTGEAPPRTLDGARGRMPDANLVTISVPGPYAKFEARRALRRGLHVFLFSDNVPLADEVELKRLARDLGLLCMGPDCGTAYIDGIGLGFANVVTRGRVGCVAASGTGLQAVASRLDALDEGLSHGLGVGGRDLSREVGGAMTLFALDALAADAATEIIVVISKPPAPEVLPLLEAAMARTGKPGVVCCLGARPGTTSGQVTWVATLEDAAEATVAALHGRAFIPVGFSDPAGVRARLERVASETSRRGRQLLGLYTGGTLAGEAHRVLEALIGQAASSHHILDLGADEFTLGRPHPMLDPELRAARMRAAGRAPEVGVVLVDLVLGRNAHADPAPALAAAVQDARRLAEADGRALVVVGSVVGTPGDPQGLARQVAILEGAGIAVLPSNAQAARFAACVLNPSLRSQVADLPRA